MKSSASTRRTLTLQALSCRSVLMLFAAMAVALATGLLAWGPVVLAPAAHRYADTRMLGSVPTLMNTAAGMAMLLGGLWGWIAVHRSRWTQSVQRPWSCFFACTSLSGLVGCVYHPGFAGDGGLVFAHALATSGFSLVVLGFLAERVDARFGSVKACIGAVIAAWAAAGVWWVGTASQGAGDLRALLLLQILPLLLVPAGALDLRGPYTRAADWVLLLCLYAVASVCELANGAILEWTQWISGHTLMQLGTAAVAAWVASRCTRAASRTDQGFGSFADSSQRKTSLNTSF